MTKKLEETFNLPPMDIPEIEDISMEEIQSYSEDEMHEIMERADKIDAALPQVSGLDGMDTDYDEYARKSIDAFEDLIDLGKNVEDKFAADIFNAAGTMMANALNAKTNKAQKKIEMIKLQIHKAKLEHERDKLDYLKQRHLKTPAPDAEETEGHVLTTRNSMLNDIIAGLKRDQDL
jgi:hypothetical protein